MLAEEVHVVIPAGKLLWYRNNWWTFPLRAADFIVEREAKQKRAALRCFKSQQRLALQNVVTLSGFEARLYGSRAASVEAFRFAR